MLLIPEGLSGPRISWTEAGDWPRRSATEPGLV